MSISAPDFKSMSRNDQVVLGAGLLVFISSFFPWYGSSGVTVQGFGHIGGGSISAWHSYSTLALLVALVGIAVAAAAIFASGSLPELPVAPRVLAAGLLALGTLLELIRILTLHHGDGVGLKWGAYVLIIAMVACTVAAALTAKNDLPTGGGFTSSGGSTPPTA
jgi:hypothetical protein